MAVKNEQMDARNDGLAWLSVSVVALAAGSAHAQWSVVSLHPANASSSEIFAGDDDTQGGYVYAGATHAAWWHG